MALSNLLSHWRTEATIGSNVVEWRTIPGRSAVYINFPEDIHPLIMHALNQLGITALYTHQADAFDQVKAGNNPIIITGTASGKTLAYNLPILNNLLSNPHNRALYLFPTKALAQDQQNKLKLIIHSNI